MRLSLFLFLSLISSFVFTQTASFTPASAGGCSPFVVSFDATTSTGTGTLNYIWDFGNGNTSSGTDKNITSAIYTTEGTYTISLQVEDNNGTSTTFTDQITVFSEPNSSFSITQPVTGCIPYSVSYQDNSVPVASTIVSWIWDFGDGNISTQQNPTHTYTNTGVYDLSLIVIDDNGCQGDTTVSDFMELFSPFSLDFETNPNNAQTSTCLDNISVDFNGLPDNTGGPYTYAWNFGDGSSSTEQNPAKTYSSTGVFNVTLQVTDQTSQCVVSETKANYIEIEDVNPSFITDINTGCIGLNVQFENTSNVIKNGQVVTWYYGDGDSLQGNATNANILNTSHSYNSIGTYTPSIKVNTNNGECIETYTLPSVIQTSNPPTVDFIADTTESCKVPVDVTFTSTTSAVTSHAWNFGNGGTSSSITPTHTYNNFGLYDVTLLVTDSLGCTSQITKNDYILIEAPVAEFTSDIFDNAIVPNRYNQAIDLITGGCIPLDIEFYDLSTSPTPIIQRDWDFGDGNTLSSNDSTPTNTYTLSGIYQTSLTITTSDGCVATYICDTCAKAGEQPTALLDTSMYPLQMCCEIDHTFLSLTDTTTVDYIWYETSTGATQGIETSDILLLDANFTYLDQLPIEDTLGLPIDLDYYVYENGCMDSIHLEDWTTLYQPYVEPITIVDPCNYDSLLVIDSIYFNSNIDSIYWDFPYNNQFSNDIYPTFISPDTTQSIILSVTAFDQTHKYTLENGDSLCSCTTEQSLYFPGKDIPIDFTVDTVYGCIPLNIDFTGIVGYNAYNWDFGDGKSGDTQTTSTSYDTTGTFNIQLVTTDNAGCNDTVIKSQFIESIGPEPAIDSTELYGCLPLTFTITDIGKYEADIVDRFWVTEVGDTILNDSILTHTITSTLALPYLQSDGVDITLFVTDTNGCTNATSINAYIGKPIPDFYYTQSPACNGDSVQLFSIENDTTGFAPFTYKWTFSDGTNSTFDSTTKYLAKGSHTIELILADSLGCTDTSNAQVATIDFIDAIPNFGADVTIATCPPFVVQFMDSSIAGRSPIVGWNWDLGDASPRTIQNPGIIFTDTTSGVDITLIITDSLGCTDTIMQEDFITITGVTGSFNIDNDVICDNETVTFTAQSPNGTFYTWDLGDGGFAEGDTVSYDYTLSGTRFPTLVIQDSTKLCSTSYTDTITILPKPKFDLGSDSTICDGFSFTISPGLSDMTYEWSTGQTSDSIIVSVADTFVLKVTDPINNCFNFDTIVSAITPLPSLETDSPVEVCVGATTTLSLVSNKSIITYDWMENGSTFSTDSTPSILTDTADRYIDITIEDVFGCSQSESITIITGQPPEVTNRSYDVCDGIVFTLNTVDLDDQDISDRYAWYRDTTFVDSTSSIDITEDDVVQLIYTTNFCIITIEATITYHEYPIPTPNELIYFCIEDESSTSITPGESDQYYWHSTGDSTANLEIFDEGLFMVDIGNEWDCFSPDSIEAKNLCGPKVFIADAFSPNNDDINDLFEIKGRATGSFSLTIFDRWGEIIYYTEDIDIGWDGFYNDQKIPEGTYPWIVKYTGLPPLYDKDITEYEGRVTVVR